LHGDVLSPAAGQALSLETLGLAEAAFESYLRCVSDDPLDAHCWRGLARAYQGCGQAEQARACWQQVKALDPDAVDAAQYLNSLP
jgi:tetratricopeptide (TPR) repeat protein